jgi:hypothetical protein
MIKAVSLWDTHQAAAASLDTTVNKKFEVKKGFVRQTIEVSSASG